MTIEEVLIVIKTRLILKSTLNGRFTASLERSDTVTGTGYLKGAIGFGHTIPDAIANLCEKISNQDLVVDASREQRREFQLPDVVSIKDN